MAEPQSLGAFGRRTDEELEVLDDDPIPFELYGYEVKADEKGNHAEHEFTFHIRPALAFGPYFTALQQADAKGNIPVQLVARFIGKQLVADEQDVWLETLDRTDLEFFSSTLEEMGLAMMERYRAEEDGEGVVEGFPSAPRSARRSGPRRTATTSTAGHSGRGSTSGSSAPRTRSTSSTR